MMTDILILSAFPAGPFVMAAKFGVPLCIVFAIKKDKHTYDFSVEKLIQVERVRGEEQLDKICKELLEQYIFEVENIARKYPHQWFNYYDFWK